MLQSIEYLDFVPNDPSDREGLRKMALAGNPDAAEIQREYEASRSENSSSQPEIIDKIDAFLERIDDLRQNQRGDGKVYGIEYELSGEPDSGEAPIVMSLHPGNNSMYIAEGNKIRIYDVVEVEDGQKELMEDTGGGGHQRLSAKEEKDLLETLDKLSKNYTSAKLLVH